MPPDLLAQLDDIVAQRGMPNRSQAICEMIRNSVGDHASADDSQVLAGTITFVYSSRHADVRTRLDQLQRRFLKEIISSQHVFLERGHGLEVLLVQGPARRLADLRDAISALRGVTQAFLTTTAERLPPIHYETGGKR